MRDQFPKKQKATKMSITVDIVERPQTWREVPWYVWKTLPYLAPLRWYKSYKKQFIPDDIIAGF